MPAVYRNSYDHSLKIVRTTDGAGFVTINVVDALGQDALVSLLLADALKFLSLLAEEIVTIDQNWDVR